MSSLGRATAVMTIGTVFSRLTGLLRIAAIAGAIGVTETRLADTYNLANTAPNIIYELVLGGILTSVFVPVFVELLEKEGRERAWEVASGLINVAVVVLVVMATIGVILAPAIADFYSGRLSGPDAQEQKQALTFLLRLFIPQIIFYGLAAMTAGLLNAHKRFGPPMYTPILNNLGVILVFVMFARAYGVVSLDEVTTGQLLILGLGTTAGVVLMAVAQLPFLRRIGKYRPTLKLRHPAVKKLAALSVFVIGYVAVNQIGYVVVQWLSNKQQGGYSAYINAFTFFLLPHGLFAVSVITALLPGMSEHAVHQRWDEFRARLSSGVRATMLLILPAAVGYLVLSDSIISFLLERGIMTERSTELVSDVLRIFVIGLLPFSVFQLFLRAFYAIQDTKTPFLINCVAVALNTAINVPMFAAFGVKGLAAGHAIAYTVGAALQARALRKRIGGLDGRRILHSAQRIVPAAVVMGAVVWGVDLVARELIPGDGLVLEGIALALPLVAGGIAYLALARALKVEELTMITGILGRRFKRTDPTGR